jgi:hypothetical protein
MVGPGGAVDPRIPPSTARILAGKIRPNGSSVSRRLSAGDRATVIAPSKWESSRRSVETASGRDQPEPGGVPVGPRGRRMGDARPAAEDKRDEGRRTGGIDQPLIHTQGMTNRLCSLAPGRECSRRAPVQREGGGGCIRGGGGFLDQGQPASAHGVGASQSGRSVRVSSRRSCTSSLCVGLPQYQ